MNANFGANYANDLDAHLHVLLKSLTYDVYVENESMQFLVDMVSNFF